MATSTAAQLAPSRASQAPKVNLSDMPELMPGAQPGSNPAQREEFQQRCRQLYREEEHETREAAEHQRAAAGSGAGVSDLEAMFPLLDPGLIRALHAEAPTPQHAIETLLALNASMAPGDEKSAQRSASPPPRQLGVEDHAQFPTLMDGNGWQVVNQRTLDEEQKEDLGSIWRDRAKAAADIPAPRPSPPSNAPAWGAKQRQRRPKDREEKEEDYLLPTDYELRQKAGERRARHRAQYGRGASGRAAGAGRGAKPTDEVDEDSEGIDEDGEEGLC